MESSTEWEDTFLVENSDADLAASDSELEVELAPGHAIFIRATGVNDDSDNECEWENDESDSDYGLTLVGRVLPYENSDGDYVCGALVEVNEDGVSDGDELEATFTDEHDLNIAITIEVVKDDGNQVDISVETLENALQIATFFELFNSVSSGLNGWQEFQTGDWIELVYTASNFLHASIELTERFTNWEVDNRLTSFFGEFALVGNIFSFFQGIDYVRDTDDANDVEGLAGIGMVASYMGELIFEPYLNFNFPDQWFFILGQLLISAAVAW